MSLVHSDAVGVSVPIPLSAGEAASILPADSYRAIALELCRTVEGLIMGLPDLLKTGDLKDEEGLIDAAYLTLDGAAFRLASLDLETDAAEAANKLAGYEAEGRMNPTPATIQEER